MPYRGRRGYGLDFWVLLVTALGVAVALVRRLPAALLRAYESSREAGALGCRRDPSRCPSTAPCALF